MPPLGSPPGYKLAAPLQAWPWLYTSYWSMRVLPAWKLKRDGQSWACGASTPCIISVVPNPDGLAPGHAYDAAKKRKNVTDLQFGSDNITGDPIVSWKQDGGYNEWRYHKSLIFQFGWGSSDVSGEWATAMRSLRFEDGPSSPVKNLTLKSSALYVPAGTSWWCFHATEAMGGQPC